MTDYPNFTARNVEAEIRLTSHLGLEETCILNRMLRLYWESRQPLPVDDRKLAAALRVRVGQWRKAKRSISDFFDLTPDGWCPSDLSLQFCRPGEDWDDLIAAASQEGGAS